MKKERNPKNWNEVKTNDSWAIFKIMGEFVSGYEKLSKIGPCVSIFGSARTKPDDKYYQLAENIAKNLSDNGYGVICFNLIPIFWISFFFHSYIMFLP